MTMTTPRAATVQAHATGLEPVSVSEAKRHLEIAETDDTHDTHVESLVIAARQLWEHDTQSLAVSRTVTEKIESWPMPDWRFYHRPVSSVTSVSYFDVSNASQTLASSIYSLDAENRRLLLAYDQVWPSTVSRWDAITLTYVAGQSTVDEIVKQAMKLQIDVMFELRGTTKEKDACIKAYEVLVDRYQRSSYP